jgi:hypothetical protein
MDLRRLRAGEWIAAVAGVVLLAVMPLNWYDADAVIRTPPGFDPPPGGFGVSAWGAFTVVDVLMAASALLAIGLLVLVAVARQPSLGITSQTLGMIATSVVAIVVLLRLIDLPEAAEGGASGIEYHRTLACYLGTAAAVAIPVGLLVAMRDERPSRGDRLTDGTGAPVDSAPVPERLPAPAP